MTKLLIIYLGILLIKAVVSILPQLISRGLKKIIPYKKYTAEEVIRCKHMRPDLYYKKQLIEQEAMPKIKPKIKFRLKPKEITISTNVYIETNINTIREKFKTKMQHRELTRCQVIAIRNYLESIVDCKGKKFSNDCHCIYYCLKHIASEQMLDMTALLNLLN